jgi:signal transduction histidine kinase
VEGEFNRWGDVSDLPDDELVARRVALENRIVAVRDQEAEFLRYLREQLESVNVSRDDTGRLDELEALEQRAVQLEEQAEADLQLTQLGMAVEVINHEFDANIRTIRENLRRLRAWADVNPEMEGLYQNVRSSFEHLDSYLTLFTPLHRRLQRTETEITGKAIALFIRGLFGERFQRHGISLEVTDSFSRRTVIGYPSSYYPVFVNLVDNAAFWVKDRSERRVVLDADATAFIVWDTGPGIAERDREAIFEFGFTRKPNGRGMGLHISREVLHRIGGQLVLAPSCAGRGAAFRVELPAEEGV